MAEQNDGVAGFTAPPDLQAKLDSLDDNLQPIEKDLREDDKSAEVSEEENSKENEDSEQIEETAEDNESEENESSDESKDSDESDTEDGYTIDEGEEDDEEEVASNSTQEAKVAENLTPEQQYILDNVKSIKVRGYVGDSEKLEVFDILAAEQLPDGFKFVDDKERTLAINGFNQLEQKAVQLQNDYRNQESRKASQEFQQREDSADRQDIGSLQRNGEIPKFKADPDSKSFENDPAVQYVQEILDYKEAKNDQYLQEYNAGRPYKHIGFEEAYRMFKAANPNKGDTALAKEDADRKSLAKRTGKAKGTSSNEPKQNKPQSGMTSRDLDNLIENLDW